MCVCIPTADRALLLLLCAGAAPGMRDIEGRTPLTRCIEKASVFELPAPTIASVCILAEYGADVNEPFDSDGTLVLYACWNKLDFAKKMMDCGANPLLTNEHGRSGLDMSYGDVRVYLQEEIGEPHA